MTTETLPRAESAERATIPILDLRGVGFSASAKFGCDTTWVTLSMPQALAEQLGLLPRKEGGA